MFQLLRPLPSTFSIAATTLQQFGRSSRRARGLRAGRPATLTPPSMGKNRKNKNKKRMLPVLGEASKKQISRMGKKRRSKEWAARRRRLRNEGKGKSLLHPDAFVSEWGSTVPSPACDTTLLEVFKKHEKEVEKNIFKKHEKWMPEQHRQKWDCDMWGMCCACPRGCTNEPQSGEGYCNDCAPGTGNAPCFCTCWCEACMVLG